MFDFVSLENIKTRITYYATIYFPIAKNLPNLASFVFSL